MANIFNNIIIPFIKGIYDVVLDIGLTIRSNPILILGFGFVVLSYVIGDYKRL